MVKNIIQKCTYPTIQDKNGYDITGMIYPVQYVWYYSEIKCI